MVAVANDQERLRRELDVVVVVAPTDGGTDYAMRRLTALMDANLLVLRAERTDASVARRAGDCGRLQLSDTPSTYESGSASTVFAKCTDWNTQTFDISAYRGKTVRLLFITGEAGTDFSSGNAFLVRKVEIQEEQ